LYKNLIELEWSKKRMKLSTLGTIFLAAFAGRVADAMTKRSMATTKHTLFDRRPLIITSNFTGSFHPQTTTKLVSMLQPDEARSAAPSRVRKDKFSLFLHPFSFFVQKNK
jgi:hypothetical protein